MGITGSFGQSKGLLLGVVHGVDQRNDISMVGRIGQPSSSCLGGLGEANAPPLDEGNGLVLGLFLLGNVNSQFSVDGRIDGSTGSGDGADVSLGNGLAVGHGDALGGNDGVAGRLLRHLGASILGVGLELATQEDEGIGGAGSSDVSLDLSALLIGGSAAEEAPESVNSQAVDVQDSLTEGTDSIGTVKAGNLLGLDDGVLTQQDMESGGGIAGSIVLGDISIVIKAQFLGKAFKDGLVSEVLGRPVGQDSNVKVTVLHEVDDFVNLAFGGTATEVAPPLQSLQSDGSAFGNFRDFGIGIGLGSHRGLVGIAGGQAATGNLEADDVHLVDRTAGSSRLDGLSLGDFQSALGNQNSGNVTGAVVVNFHAAEAGDVLRRHIVSGNDEGSAGLGSELGNIDFQRLHVLFAQPVGSAKVNVDLGAVDINDHVAEGAAFGSGIRSTQDDILLDLNGVMGQDHVAVMSTIGLVVAVQIVVVLITGFLSDLLIGSTDQLVVDLLEGNDGQILCTDISHDGLELVIGATPVACPPVQDSGRLLDFDIQDVHHVNTGPTHACVLGLGAGNGDLTLGNQNVGLIRGPVVVDGVTSEGLNILHTGIVGGDDEGSAGLGSGSVDSSLQLGDLLGSAGANGAEPNVDLSAVDSDNSMAKGAALLVLVSGIIGAVGNFQNAQVLDGIVADQIVAGPLAISGSAVGNPQCIGVAQLGLDLLFGHAQSFVVDHVESDNGGVDFLQGLDDLLEAAEIATPGVDPPVNKGLADRSSGLFGSNIQREGSGGGVHLLCTGVDEELATGGAQTVVGLGVSEGDAFRSQDGNILAKGRSGQLDTGVGDVAADLGVTGNDGVLAPLLVGLGELGPVALIVEVGSDQIHGDAFHIQQDVSVATALGVSPSGGVAFHQDLGLSLADGVDREDQVAHGVVTGLEVAGGILGGIPNGCVVDVVVIQSVVQTIDQVSLVVGGRVLVDQRQDHDISRVLLQVRDDLSLSLSPAPLVLETECGQHGDIHLGILELGTVRGQLGAQDVISVLVEGDVQSLDILFTDDVQRIEGLQAGVGAAGHQVVLVDGVPVGGPNSDLHVLEHGVETGGLAAQAVVSNLQNISVQLIGHQGEVHIVGLVQSGVTNDHDLLISDGGIGDAEDHGLCVIVGEQDGEHILVADGQELDLGVADLHDLTHVGHDQLVVLALCELAGNLADVLELSGEAVLPTIAQLTGGSVTVGNSNMVQNHLLNGDLLCPLFGSGQGAESTGVVTVSVGQDPGSDNDLAVFALVHFLQGLVNILSIGAGTTVDHDEGAVSQGEDLALADVVAIAVLIIQVKQMQLGSDAGVSPTGVGSGIVDQQLGAGQDHADGGAVHVAGRLVSLLLSGSHVGGIIQSDAHGQILHQDSILALHVSGETQLGNILPAIQSIGLVQLVASGFQSSAVSVEVSSFDLVVAHNNSAEVGVHSAQELTGGERGSFRNIVHLADHGQGQVNVSGVDRSQRVQSADSGDSGIVVPTGNDQLAIDDGDDPLVSADHIQSSTGGGILGQTDQSGLGSVSVEDIILHFAGVVLVVQDAGAAEQHINVGSIDLRTVGAVLGSGLAIPRDVGTQVVTLLNFLCPQELAVLLEGDFLSVDNFVVQVVGNDSLQLSSNAGQGNVFGDFEGLLGGSCGSGNGASNAQQQRAAQNQHEPSLLEDVLHAGQSDQANQRSSSQHTKDDHAIVAGLGRAIVVTTGSGGGNFGSVYGQAVFELCLSTGGHGSALVDQSAGGQRHAGGQHQLSAKVIHTNIGVGNQQSDIDGLACGIFSLIGRQLSSHTVLRAGGGKGGSAEQTNRNQESQCKENR